MNAKSIKEISALIDEYQATLQYEDVNHGADKVLAKQVFNEFKSWLDGLRVTSKPLNINEYLNGRNGLEYYQRIKQLTEKQLSDEWQEVNESAYWHFLDACFPSRCERFAFACGEPSCDGVEGTIHVTGVQFDSRYFLRPATVEQFNRDRYVNEIMNKFNLGPQ